MTSWDRFRVTEDQDRFWMHLVFFEFSTWFACSKKRRFVCFVVSRNELYGCVCFSKTFDKDYSFVPFRD